MPRAAPVALLFLVSASLPCRCTAVAAFAARAEQARRHHNSIVAPACKQRRIWLETFIGKRSFGSLRQRLVFPIYAQVKEDSCVDVLSTDLATTLDHRLNVNVTITPTEVTDKTISSSYSSSLLLWGVPLQSIILLNVAAVIWGTQHSVIKSVVDDISLGPDVWFREWLHGVWGTYHQESVPAAVVGDGDAAAYFTLARFGLAALLASPYTPGLDEFLNGLRGRVGVDSEEDCVNEVTRDSDDDRQNMKLNKGVNLQTQQSKQSINGDSLASTSHETNLAEWNETSLSWRYGLELGIYMFLGYAFQAIGLESTTASRSGFLLYLNVKLVPFFSFLIFGRRIRTTTWISALVAFLGTALLSLDNANGRSFDSGGVGLNFALNAGDLWSIAAAAASAMFILRMEEASKAVRKSSELNAASLWTVFAISFCWTAVVSWNNLSLNDIGDGFDTNAQFLATTIQNTVAATVSTIVDHPLQLIYLSAVTTTLANYIQSVGQKDISAERASIIYAMDPVYGAIFANLLLEEQLGAIGWVGSGLIVAAAVANAVWDFGRVDEDSQA
eukprot:CCRYP_014268-RA/>CCRYP_014268-RA protein AED:0.44 eAED:0.44 QI:0/-1/0/1/-1/1/1/0/557